jgi:hypothetical protein
MKRRGTTKTRFKPDDEKVIISSEYFTNDRPSYICSICNRTLSRLSDAGGNNSTYFCTNCSVTYDIDIENVRRESKLSVPNRNEETLVAQTPGIPDVSIRHTPEIKGGLKALQEKGIKITDYKEDIPRPRTKR